MKKTFSTLVIVIVSYCSYAQTNIFPANGNVGIGTVSPLYPLTVIATVNGTPFGISDGTRGVLVKTQTHAGITSSGAVIGYYDGVYNDLEIRTQSEIGSQLYLKTDGNVGIGTTTPTEKLAVKGKIRAQEIKVELSNWPDYVFTKDYKLPSLPETEKHIKEKGYLPGIPSAAEVKANGVDLGEMNAKLLKKITLYLIEQNQEIKKLNAKVEALQKIKE